jgi:phosphatidylinositol alpha-1,6-mannosyltransferase
MCAPASPAFLASPASAQPPIYLITHEFYPKHGGIATFAEEIARAATTLGRKIEVWAQSAAAAKEKHWPFAVRRLPIKGTLDLACRAGSMLALIKRRRELRDATVYIPEPGPMLALMLLQFNKSMRPKEIILTFHGSEILRMHANPAHRMLMRRLIKRATRISTLTGFTRDLLHEHFPEAKGKTIITPGAIRSDLLAGGASNNAGLTTPPFAQNELPVAAPGKTVVLTVGRIHPRKGQANTLRALKNLPLQLRRATEYWIVGKINGSGYERLLVREAAAEAAAGPGLTVRFLGDIPDRELGGVYSRADIFAMTSINYHRSVEGFGLVYLEASAHGLPVVAHKVGGVHEAVIDGETGLLVDPAPDTGAPSAALTAAFEKLLSDAPLRRRMGEAGRRHAQNNSWIDSAKKLFAPPDVSLDVA